MNVNLWSLQDSTMGGLDTLYIYGGQGGGIGFIVVIRNIGFI